MLVDVRRGEGRELERLRWRRSGREGIEAETWLLSG
jgi:hypothetical protein